MYSVYSRRRTNMVMRTLCLIILAYLVLFVMENIYFFTTLKTSFLKEPGNNRVAHLKVILKSIKSTIINRPGVAGAVL